MSNTRFTKLVIFVNALVPLLLLLWDLYHHNVGANPQEFAIRTTGMLTLVFLTLTVAITPLRKTFGINSLVKFRRMLGLFAFFYGFLHLTSYIWLDRLFNFVSVVQDVARRPFILVGMTGFLLMVPLAITSTNKMVKRLGGKRCAPPSIGLCRSGRRSPALLDAGEIRRAFAVNVRIHRRLVTRPPFVR